MPDSRFFVSQRLRLHHLDWGNPEAPPLILIHGVRDHNRCWDFVAERLRDRWHVIAPDLRGHGMSEWAGGGYPTDAYVYDLWRLIAEAAEGPVTIMGHSLGGNVGLRYAGAYPDNVAKIIAIEGLAASPKMIAESRKKRIDQKLRAWVDKQHALANRQPRRYATLEEAIQRMSEENKHLSPELAAHLTRHGVNRNEDGTYSWKFDTYLRVFPLVEMPPEDVATLWSCVTCPTLLVYGGASWASDPREDGRAAHFPNAKVVSVQGAGHWVHHDRFEEFMALTEDFLQIPLPVFTGRG